MRCILRCPLFYVLFLLPSFYAPVYILNLIAFLSPLIPLISRPLLSSSLLPRLLLSSSLLSRPLLSSSLLTRPLLSFLFAIPPLLSSLYVPPSNIPSFYPPSLIHLVSPKIFCLSVNPSPIFLFFAAFCVVFPVFFLEKA